jgi:hypothetical protein
VSAFGPSERNCDGLSIRNGFKLPTQASGSRAPGTDGSTENPIGRQSPAPRPIVTVNGAMNPSPARSASIAAAAASPALTPSCSMSPSGIEAIVAA